MSIQTAKGSDSQSLNDIAVYILTDNKCNNVRTYGYSSYYGSVPLQAPLQYPLIRYDYSYKGFTTEIYPRPVPDGLQKRILI